MTPTQLRMRIEGRCTRCGQPKGGRPQQQRMWFCDSCRRKVNTPEQRARNRAYAKAQRAQRILDGLCTRCGATPVKVFAWCLFCRQQHADLRRAA